MNYSLGYTLGRSMVFSRGDADALAYIAAVEGTGTSVSATQKTAINDFYVAAKADSYYTSLKRLYLPIWASAAPNAIDMIGLTSGTFNGTVTHSAGYVQGDGSTGYFEPPTGSEYGNLGLSNSSASIFYLALDETVKTQAFHGLAGSGTERFAIGVPATLATMFLHPDSAPATLVQFAGQRSGIFVGSSTATDSRTLLRTSSSGFTRGSNTVSNTSTPPNIVPFFMARNNNGSPGLYTNSKFGLFGVGLGLSSTDDENYSLALKNLWETCTGLTLP
jgi:hypothetical protein